MAKNNSYIIKLFNFCIVATALLLTACNDYLDKLPDDRTEVNTELKATQLLVSCYPDVNNHVLMELSSDNVGDNGRSYSSPVLCDDLYKFKDTNEESWETPYTVWNGYYKSVASVNEVLQAINNMGNGEELRAARAEAKMIRAFSMFQLAVTFCMAWDDAKADEYLGLPYPTEPEQDINTTYVRGTLRELYAAIDKDIEEALPDIELANERYKTPKFHFNTKAAYAFAARFNLYYCKYDKAIKYASEVLGNDPTAVMRDFEPYRELGRADFGTRWIRSDEGANLLLLISNSISSRYLANGHSARWVHNSTMASYETYWVTMPWGDGSDANSIIYANKLYGTNQSVSFPEYHEEFEYTDKVGGIGYPHVVETAFTGDMTILERAEAYTLAGRLNEAVQDINTWIGTHCKDKYEDGELKQPAPQNLSMEDIVGFVNGLEYAKRNPTGSRDRSMRKHMHPQGFTIDAEGSNQEAMLQFILHMKRLETLYHGIRFMDIKRYGIEYAHPISGESPLYFIRGDLRGAIQLPNTVIVAGLQANPRLTQEEIDKFVQDTEKEYMDEDEEE